MPSDRPRATAILPGYNAAEFIGPTLDCLAAQTWPELEILIGDDASADATPQILRDFAQGRPNVELVLRERNLGWVGNCNDLMARATGEMMFFAFHDDVVSPDYVEALAGALIERPEAVMAFSDLDLVPVGGEARRMRFRALEGVSDPFARAGIMVRRPDGWWIPNRGLFRAEAFRRIGGMKTHEAGELSADWPWLLHMSTLGEFVRVPRPLCRKRYTERSLSRSWRRGPERMRALDRAGAREIRASPLGFWGKLRLRAFLALRAGRRGASDRLPKALRGPMRRLLGPLGRGLSGARRAGGRGRRARPARRRGPAEPELHRRD